MSSGKYISGVQFVCKKLMRVGTMECSPRICWTGLLAIAKPFTYQFVGFLNLIASLFVVDTNSVLAESDVRWHAYIVYVLLLDQTAWARTLAKILDCGQKYSHIS